MRHWQIWVLIASIGCFLPSCGNLSEQSPTGKGLDYWGNRPGPKNFRTVIIDAGHGGHDSGAVSPYTGQREKDLNLDVARRLRAQLRKDFRLIMLRDDDRFIDLDDRVRMANRHGGAILVSVHFNSGASHRRGPETYFWRVDSHGLAVRCQQAMVSVSPSEHRNAGLSRRRLRLTRNPQIPSVLLEGGYLSHSGESRLIANSSYRQRLAEAIAGAIRDQARLGDQGTGPRPKPIKAPPSRATDSAGS